MPRYNIPPGEAVLLLSPKKIEAMFYECRDLRDKAFFSLMVVTGARISELLALKQEDIEVAEGYLTVELITKKLGKGTFYPPKRPLKFKLNSMLSKTPPYCYYEAIAKYVLSLPTEETLLFDFVVRTGEYKIEKISKKVLGKGLSPHVFRHWRFSDLARKGASLTELKFIKGAKRASSVEAYLQNVEREVVITE